MPQAECASGSRFEAISDAVGLFARVREGGAVLCSFIDWFLLLLVARCLLACLVSLSCLVSRESERASYLHLFGFEQFGAWIISLSL